MPQTIAVIRLGRLEYGQALRLQELLADARRQDAIGDVLLLVQHPPVITFGRGGGAEDLRVSPEALRRAGIGLYQTERGGRATYHGPGQLVAYPILKLPDDDLHTYLWRLEQTILDLLNSFGVAAGRVERHPGAWVGNDKIAAIGVAERQRVTMHGLAINVDPPIEHFGLIVPCGITGKGVTSMRRVLGHPVDFDAVETAFVRAFARAFNATIGDGARMPPWLVAQAPQGEAVESLDGLLDGLGLATGGEDALCPNLGECWGSGTATFMILGELCTRHCAFCAVQAGRPLPPDPTEPERLAEAAARMGLSHVVITSVTRDDLPDGGAAHFAATIAAVRRRCPGATIEVLVPDFGGALSALATVIAARPDVFNHNLETVPRLYSHVRPRAGYRRSLAVLDWARRAGLVTKSGLILGLGETAGEVVDVMHDLRRAGCQILTLGQYLQPTSHNLPVARYLNPIEFEWYREVSEELGFRAVAAGPLVRSSYHAKELWGTPRNSGELRETREFPRVSPSSSQVQSRWPTTSLSLATASPTM